MERLAHYVFAFLLLLLPSTASATDAVKPIAKSESVPDFTAPILLDFGVSRYDLPEDDFLGQITMRSYPAGSLVTRYGGFQAFAVKHVRSQYRRFVRQALKKGWYVLPDDTEPTRGTYMALDHDWSDTRVNGSWWTRNWWESLPPDKGGAPKEPHVHTIGSETAWKFGPITVTNTFNLRFDYVGFFELNPDPISHEHGKRSLPIALDVKSTQTVTTGTRFQIKLRPNFRIGMPRGGDLESILRGLSLRAPFKISHHNKEVIEGEAEIKWRPEDGLLLTLEVALVSW